MGLSKRLTVNACLCGFGLLVVTAATGCQSDYAGQTLPAPYWLQDDIQYFPPGPEFKLSREAAALKEYWLGTRRPQCATPLVRQAAPLPRAEN